MHDGSICDTAVPEQKTIYREMNLKIRAAFSDCFTAALMISAIRVFMSRLLATAERREVAEWGWQGWVERLEWVGL